MEREKGAAATGKTLPAAAVGLAVDRLYTRPGIDPLAAVEYVQRSSVIRDPDGSEVFRMDGIEVPRDWSQLATDVMVSKYFRKAGVPGTGSERSARQVIERVSRSLREAGDALGGYFRSAEDAEAFEAELAHLLVSQMAAFNSPVWFNLGLDRYGIRGSGGNWAWDFAAGEARETEDAYSRPLCSACFIQSVEDDLMSIFQLVKSEARLFKYGSGTGTNFSSLRSREELLSGGGTSSGLMSFLEVFDRSAGATKSGGTTRRAAKMVCVGVDHPEIQDFIRWKVREEAKARALIGAGYPADFNGEAYRTVAGQNANNSVRLPDAFLEAAVAGGSWETRFRTTGELHRRWNAADLLEEMAEAAWACADPGLQYDSTINRWHTCPASGPIRASNPCSEFMFLDDTACNLASLNLLRFLGEDGRFQVASFQHAVRLLIIAQEILVDHAAYPTQRIAENSHRFRPLGLGYAGLGAFLMSLGIPYDSDGGRAFCAAITSLMTGRAYEVSAELAEAKGPFEAWPENAEPFRRVIEQHRQAARETDPRLGPADLPRAALEAWERAIARGERAGYRNAQATVLAPTGTIGLLMDCETTGIEPDFALVKFKKLAGGGHFKIVNQALGRALRSLGYGEGQSREIIAYVSGTLTLEGAPHLDRRSLLALGLPEASLERIEQSLPSVLHLAQAFSPRVVGAAAQEALGLDAEACGQPGFDLLAWLGFTPQQVAEASEVICGRLTVEGAPHLRAEHLPVFDCASRCGERGTRWLAPMAHLKMMAAAQPFLSGAISKTVNLPQGSTPQEIRELFLQGWRMGLKALAVYRDGCKGSQPLSAVGERRGAVGAERPGAGQPAAAGRGPVPLQRLRLPKKRGGFTQESRVGGHKVYLRTGEYEDGRLGEIFLDMHKEGAALRSMMNCFAIAISLGLQYGVPLKEYVDCFTFTKFEPQGVVDGHPNIKWSTSIIDYIFRVLAFEYLGMTDFLQIQPAGPGEEPGSPREGGAGRLPAGAPEGTPGTAAGDGGPAGESRSAREGGDSLSGYLAAFAGDAPFCDQCGHITVRSGACYRCLNCGNSMGCS